MRLIKVRLMRAMQSIFYENKDRFSYFTNLNEVQTDTPYE